MGELERQDWREVLADYQIEDILAALDRLMRHPPKMQLPDGSAQPYAGRPTVVNVVHILEQWRAEDRAWERKEAERKALKEAQEWYRSKEKERKMAKGAGA